MTDFIEKKVLVTGGAGFIGVNLVNALVESGANVDVLDLPTADFSSLPVGINQIKINLLELDQLEHDLLDYDFVFHLAAKTDLSGKNLADYAVNFEGTQLLIDSIRESKHLQKFVFYSTQLVVGIFNETRFIPTDEPYRTKTIYGQSKIIGEMITQDLCETYSIPYCIVRPTSVFGPFGKVPYRDFFLSIKNGPYFHIGKANNLISMVFVKNLVDQTLFLAINENSNGMIFFGNDLHPYTMRQFVDVVAAFYDKSVPTIPKIIVYPVAYLLGILKLIGIPVPLYPFRLHNMTANYCYDIGNSLKLGYYPRFSLSKAIEETLSWYEINDPDFS
jgi:nucleoside-diphosphate-sugar epimerase